MKPIFQIKDPGAARYQIANLQNGTTYWFAVTAVDHNGGEGKVTASVSAVTSAMPRGAVDPFLNVDIYKPELAWAGTTLLVDSHDFVGPGRLSRIRAIEVNMLGEIVWQYTIDGAVNGANDAVLLPDNDILLLVSGKGVYEITRAGNTVWSYLDAKADHCVEMLPNGNILVSYGFYDTKNDAQVKEINRDGKVVWSWYARDYFDKPPYSAINRDGWTHTNAAHRLANGDTLISLRNFDLVVEVDPKGAIVRTIGPDRFKDQHDPELLPNGNLLAANHKPVMSNNALEIDLQHDRVVWRFGGDQWGDQADIQTTHDADRLPNGNTLVTGSTKMVEVTPEGQIVWQLRLTANLTDPNGQGFFKSYRLWSQR